MTATLVDGAADAPVVTRPGRVGPLASGISTTAIGALGVAVGLAGVLGSVPSLRIGWLLPLAGVQLDIDRLGGFFIALTGAVAVVVGIYSIGYARHERWSLTTQAMLPLFVGAMLLVPAAGTTTTFLLGWELMALTSLVLILSGHRRAEVRSAAVYYAVMTQIGFALVLLALMIMASAAGTDRFAGIAGLHSGVRNLVFVLTVLGFGSKSGLLPLHAWLPRAHPEAPSPVSALMSAAMVNLGVYGLIRIDVQLLGPGPRWWGAVLLAIGAVSALYGVLQASVAPDLKRLLGYSTIENMGLISLALGTAMLLAASGLRAVATVAMAAALFHLVAHAAFKGLGFMAAGSVLLTTGERDIDLLGGLARRMPYTTVLFGIAALGASGLPVGAGFVSEWMLVQSLIHVQAHPGIVVGVAAPLGVGAVALTTGLGVAAMVKAFGFSFLARPRSTAANHAHESPASMLAGMAAAAFGCLVVGVAPCVARPVLQATLSSLPAFDGADLSGLGVFLRLPGIDASMSPGLLAVAAGLAILLVLLLSRWGGRHRPASVDAPLWACGADELTSRMQYTASSFAQPLQHVFDNVLRPDVGVEVTHLEESRYHIGRIAYRASVADALERRIYTPVLRAVDAGAQAVRRVHTGSVQLYLAFGALGVLIVLVVAR